LKSSDSSHSSSSPIVITSNHADQQNQAFFLASKHQDSAPILSIYEGDRKTVKLRATIENSDLIQPLAIDIHGNSLHETKNKKTSNKKSHQLLHPGLIPYTQTLQPKPSESSPKKQKVTQEEYLKEQVEMKKLNESIGLQVKLNDYQRYEDRIMSATRDAVSKSQQLLYETKKITKKHQKKQDKKKKNPSQCDHFMIKERGERDISSLPSLPYRSTGTAGTTKEGEGEEEEEGGGGGGGGGGGVTFTNSSELYETVIISGSKELFRKTSLPKLENSFKSSSSSSALLEPRKVSRYIPSDLSEDDHEGYLNPYDWENLLARHILSVYATSHSQTNQTETKAILELLEEPSSPPLSSSSPGRRRLVPGYLSPSSAPSHTHHHTNSNGTSTKKNSSRKSSVLKTKELKQTGLFENLEKERTIVEKKSIRPGVTSRSTIMMLGKTATVNPLMTSVDDLKSTRRTTMVSSPSPLRPSSSLRGGGGGDGGGSGNDIKDPVNEIALKGVEKLKYSNKKPRDEIKTTLQTSGLGSVIRAPAKCFPIWFYASGDVYAEWILLPNGVKLQSGLDSLKEKKNYLKYVEIVGHLLEECWIERTMSSLSTNTNTATTTRTLSDATRNGSISRRLKFDVQEQTTGGMRTHTHGSVMGSQSPSHHSNPSLTTMDLQVLCRQYVLVCNAFATLCLENKDFNTSMMLIRIAEEWLKKEEVFSNLNERNELKAYLHITFAFYFHKKKMTSAALSHSQQALEIHRRLQKEDYVGMCLLMISCCKYQVSNFKEAHRV
jgi:hypothetical protein